MVLRRILLLLAAASALASALLGAPDIFPLKDVRAGQHGIGKTVFAGTRVEEFQVEVLGVLDNIGPQQSIILARLSGGPLANTGVMQGMSGSPVYIDGRLAGAVALGFPDAKEAIAGIRPIEEMLRVDPDVRPAASQRASVPARRADGVRGIAGWRTARVRMVGSSGAVYGSRGDAFRRRRAAPGIPRGGLAFRSPIQLGMESGSAVPDLRQAGGQRLQSAVAVASFAARR